MVALTLAEAAEVLEPAMSERQLRMIVTAIALPHAGTRSNGRPGRDQKTYDATQLMKLHAALLPFITFERA